jgi:hypothetical protein
VDTSTFGIEEEFERYLSGFAQSYEQVAAQVMRRS